MERNLRRRGFFFEGFSFVKLVRRFFFKCIFVKRFGFRVVFFLCLGFGSIIISIWEIVEDYFYEF